MRRALALAVALAGFAPGVALACLPAPLVPSPLARHGESCAVATDLTEIRSVGLGPARRHGALAAQDIFDGNACYWEANLLVHDCAAGQALVVGPDHRALMGEPRQTGIDRIAAALAAGQAETLDAVAELAAAEGYAAPLRLPVGQRILVNGHPVAIDCACRK